MCTKCNSIALGSVEDAEKQSQQKQPHSDKAHYEGEGVGGGRGRGALIKPTSSIKRMMKIAKKLTKPPR